MNHLSRYIRISFLLLFVISVLIFAYSPQRQGGLREIRTATNLPPQDALIELKLLKPRYSDETMANEINARIEYITLVENYQYLKDDAKIYEKVIENLSAVKNKYPRCIILPAIDRDIITYKALRTANSLKKVKTLDEVFQIQRQQLETSPVETRIEDFILHTKALRLIQKEKGYNPEQVSKTMIEYLTEAERLLTESVQSGKAPAQAEYIAAEINIETVYANLVSGDYKKSWEDLTSFYSAVNEGNNGISGRYSLTKGEYYELLGKKYDALAAYIDAAYKDYYEGVIKSSGIYRKMYTGRSEYYPGTLKFLLAEPSFQPKKFDLGSEWKGKTVLAEEFTTSELVSCGQIDEVFFGLMKAYDPKYVIVLRYYKSALIPDPYMNFSTLERYTTYKIDFIPSPLIDGNVFFFKVSTSRDVVGDKYNQLTSRINVILDRSPEISLQVSAEIKDNTVTVAWNADKFIDNAQYTFALAQRYGIYRGTSGTASSTMLHRMIVRDIKTLETPRQNEPVIFNIAELEKKNLQIIADSEKQLKQRLTGKYEPIDTAQLMVVFFVQDKNTKNVYNAAQCEAVVK